MNPVPAARGKNSNSVMANSTDDKFVIAAMDWPVSSYMDANQRDLYD